MDSLPLASIPLTTKATPDFADTDNNLTGLPLGTYTVQAVHKTKFCVTAPISATVNDNTPTINIVQNTTVRKLPTDCRSNDGVLEVQISAAGNVGGFKIEWFRNGSATPFATINAGTTSQQDTLSSAVYTIRATNLDNGCFVSRAFDLPFATAQSLTLVSTSDATTCSPQNEGAVVVRLTPTPAVIPGPPPIGFTVNDYLVHIYAGKSAQGAPMQTVSGSTGVSNGDGTSNYSFASLTPGFYTLVAVENNTLLGGCSSTPLVVEIKQNVTFPVIAASQVTSNTNCSGAIANGRIALDIDGAAPETNYSYSWFEGTSTSSPALGTSTSGTTSGTGEIADNLPSGMYTVRVTNNATQCVTISGFQLLDALPIISISESEISLTPVTTCSNPTAGAAIVTVVRENGTSTALSNFSFTWFDATRNILPNAGAPNTTNTINNLPAGIYFVSATKIVGSTGINCPAPMVSFEILDLTIGTVSVSLQDFTKPTRCLQTNVTGQLVADASGTSASGYSYNWYAGVAATGPILSNMASLSNINIPAGQTDVTFTVEAINNSNQCRATDTYVLPLEVVPVLITATASPLTSCISNDGVTFATVTSGNSNGYTYNWDNGTSFTAPPDAVGKQVTGLANGDYTVIAVDQADTFCQSVPVTVTINDERVFPVPTAIEVAPLTICDPSRPDGVARVSVSGDVVSYRFDWFRGVPPVGASLYTGSEFGNLPAATFSVTATHLVTGCSGTTQVTINEKIVSIPLPQVVLISNVTSCVTDNGALSASVNGNTGDFIFHWYTTNPGTSPDTTSATFTGEIYSDLNVGTYFVTATSRLTGCISAPASGVVIEAPVYPEFDFLIQRPSCNVFNTNENGSADANGEPTGSLALNMLNHIEIESITWYANGEAVGTGPILPSIEAGIYEVRVVSTVGCSASKTIELLPDINPFNGISRNGDDKNPIFHINCIENFPANQVKIFNRAGTLVYEVEGYDNVETYFDGKSNKGITVMGNNLPDGTYFYIIDKRDGSKPIAGYLEVVN